MKSIVHEMKLVLKTSITEVNKLLTAYGIDFTVDDMKQGYQVRIKKGDYETTSPLFLWQKCFLVLNYCFSNL